MRRSEEHTSELQSLRHLVCRLLLEKKKKSRVLDVALVKWRTAFFLAKEFGGEVFGIYYVYLIVFFFNDTATTEIYTLSLHDALPIWSRRCSCNDGANWAKARRSIAS